ncbi:Hypothetical predicted protein [Pelobates cultripes]|uniref:Uncharacterized protein n=1 Tax=Pelobates cultripes TaxID=61616 RepID=A0AAD1RXT3_PELCU|nr:Hypothetical predicted protein [Pelobates cultripes]
MLPHGLCVPLGTRLRLHVRAAKERRVQTANRYRLEVANVQAANRRTGRLAYIRAANRHIKELANVQAAKSVQAVSRKVEICRTFGPRAGGQFGP